MLKDVNLEVGDGELIYLLGKVGSGKSSLLKTIYGALPIASGTAMVLGQDMARIKRRKLPYLRRRLGIVFQDYKLLTDRSVEDNLLFVLKATGWKDKKLMKTQVHEVLQQVGMENKAYKKPHQLSGGEQQRVVIARALLNSPEMILADEPTGNLDPETGNEIMELFHLPPCPQVGALKQALKDAVLDNRVPNEREPLMNLLMDKARQMGITGD